MATITATNSATPSLQAELARSRLEQARREADQAESNARQLRSQADDAEQQAQQSQEKVRSIAASNQRMQSTYAPPSQARESQVPAKVQIFIENLYSATSQQRADIGNALKTDANASPVVNARGQSTGRILNVTA